MSLSEPSKQSTDPAYIYAPEAEAIYSNSIQRKSEKVATASFQSNRASVAELRFAVLRAAAMADIMLLVAEEFEKRLKRGAPGGSIGGGDEASKGRRNFGAVSKVCTSWVESSAAAASGVKVHVALLVKADVEEPKTGPSLAAFDCFFSA